MSKDFFSYEKMTLKYRKRGGVHVKSAVQKQSKEFIKKKKHHMCNFE